ncbi:MAG: DUF4082 domain-containing protein, partial [Planctomycetes bacterium]|nr:DUF4082 domain-containing protein [Planctomycetota bacterium]MCW8137173.1 DUF4082 domain-containing protein [Planctomycetota bacterium]
MNQQITSFSIPNASPRQVGWEFTCNANNVTVTHLSAVLPDAVSRVISLYQVNTQQLLAQANLPAGTAGQWRSVQLSTPVALSISTNYVVCVFIPSGFNTNWYYLSPAPTSFQPTGTVSFVNARWDGSASTTPIFPGTTAGTAQYGICDI